MKAFYSLLRSLFLTLALPATIMAQNVGISNVAITPDPESILELRSTTKGVLLPRLNNAQRATLQATPLGVGDEGLTIFNIQTDRYNYWTGSAWLEMATSGTVTGLSLDDAYNAGGAGLGRTISGNSGTVDILGSDGLYVAGNIGIGIAAPTMKLDVRGGDIGLDGLRSFAVGGWNTGVPDITPDAQMVLDGAHNSGFNLGGTKLLIRGMDNESNGKAISVVDENSFELFNIQSQPTAHGRTYFRGDVGIGINTAAEDLHIYRADTDIARVYATGGSQGSGMFYAGQSTTYGGGFSYDGDGTPALVGGTDRVTFFRRNNSTDTDVMSYAYNSNTVRVASLADASSAVITSNGAGDLGKTSLTGNANHILNGTGAFVDASVLSVTGDNLGSHAATANLNMGNREVDNITYADITAGNGYGLRFWSSNTYAIAMGNAAEYQYGPVTDYSIKNHMSNTPARGWTWGVDGLTPVAAINTTGAMQIQGTLKVSNNNATGGGIQISDDGGIYDRNDGYGTLAFNSGVDMEDAQDGGDHLTVVFNDSYPEIWSYRNGGGTLTEFRTGIYNNGGTFYSQNQIYARGGIANDAGTLLFNDNIRITGGNPAANRVLQSDASGNASWVDPSTLAVTGDNLGNHAATANLNMGNRQVDNITYADITPGTDNGVRFWSSQDYSIKMGNNQQDYGWVTDYSIHSNMGTTDNRGFTWGYSRTNVVTSLEAETGHFRTRGVLYAENYVNTNNDYRMDGQTIINSSKQLAGGLLTWTDARYLGQADNLGNHIATVGIKRSNHNVGHLEGSYNNVAANSTFTNPIYTIGSNYNPSTTALSNMYGIGYSHANFWGTGTFKPSGWGMYAAADGDIRVILDASNGIIWSSGEIRSNGGHFRGRIGVNALATGSDWQYMHRTTYGANQTNLYARREGASGATNGGNGYGYTNMDIAVKGYSYWGNSYSAGLGGYSFLDYDRSAGVHGGRYNGTSWGALGYQAVGGTEYGVYYTSVGAGAGYAPEGGVRKGIGSGGTGDLLGSWTHGDVMGHIASGEAFAAYNLGDEYTSGKQIEIVETDQGKKQAYTVTATSSKMYENGIGTLQSGSGYVEFSEDIKAMIGDGTPTVTISPMGMCNGLYLESISENGFSVKELANGNSSVEFTWIMVADRVDSEVQAPIVDVLDKEFDRNLLDLMGHENDPNRIGKAMWWDGQKVRFDALPKERDAKH